MKKVFRVPYGTKDILPEEMRQRRQVENSILAVFEKAGYSQVRTPVFEYADTYGGPGDKRDFRLFDRRNNLLVLRNDMTGAIARLASTRLQDGPAIKRLCYLANLYRYEEIQEGRQCEFEQAGLELLGASGPAADAEVIGLAIEALLAAGLFKFTISLGQVQFIAGIAAACALTSEQTAVLKDCLRRRDAVGLQELADSLKTAPLAARQLLADLLFLKGGPRLAEELSQTLTEPLCLQALADLRAIMARLERLCPEAAGHVEFDLGLYRSFDYYTGMLFEIYLPEMGYTIAGGGRYDTMMRSYGSDCPATGFALGVDRIVLALERSGKAAVNRAEEYLTIALPKGKLFDKAAALLAKVGCSGENLSDDSRKLVIINPTSKVRFIIAKTSDVPTYVEYGAADLGIIGKDVLLEQEKDVVELLDLGFGRCRLMLAVPEGQVRPRLTDYAHLRAATKYPHCARRFFNQIGIQAETVDLNGSIELGPLIGLSEMIVDIAESGRTLRENKLTEVATIFTATARLIANRASLRLKFRRLLSLVQDLRAILEEEKAKDEDNR